MTKSELIDRLAAQFPQLVAKDAELAVKMILDAMGESLAKGERIEIRGFGSFGLNYRPPRTGRNPEVGREGAGAAEVRAALQGRQGAAGAGGLQSGDQVRKTVQGGTPRGGCSFHWNRSRWRSCAGPSSPSSSSRSSSCPAEQRQTCALTFFNVATWEAPLVVVVFVAFACGVAAGPSGRRVARRAPQAPARPSCGASSAGANARRELGRYREPGTGRRLRRRAAHARRRLAAPEAAQFAPWRRRAADRRAMDFELWWLLPIPAVFFAHGLDRRAHRHQASAARVARTAAVVFPRPQLPAERAAGQGHRVVHRGGQGRSPDDRPALRAGLAVPPPGRDRPRDPHAPEPARPARPAGRATRTTATYELAQDFHRAGLLDRAEELFTKLDGTPFEHAALGHLISIYETEKDWTKAIAATRRMEELAKQPYHKEIAQYHCELAQAALLQRRLRAGRAARSRRRTRPTAAAPARPCWPAMRRRSRMRPAEAIAAWQKIESQNPAFLALAADRIADALPQAGRHGAGDPRAAQLPASQYPSLDLLNALFSLVARARGPGRGRRCSSRTSSRATRRCSGSTACSRRSSSRRRPTAATTSSW